MLFAKSDKKPPSRKKATRAAGWEPSRRLRALQPKYFADLYRAEPIKRVRAIRQGVPARILVLTSEAMRIPKTRVYSMLLLPESTTKRKVVSGLAFSPEQSERILGLQRLIGQVEVMLEESGDDAQSFDAPAWLAQWLDTPVAALGNEKPSAFMDTVAGQEIVSHLLARMQSGAYA